MPFSKRNLKIYVGFFAIWLTFLLVAEPCGSGTSLGALWLVSFTALLFILAWSFSIGSAREPTSIKNVALLSVWAIYEALLMTLAFVILCIPLLILMPAYQCYTDRAYNTEIMALVSSPKTEVTELIKASGSVENDYSRVVTPESKRIDHFQITSNGMILVHAENPSFTIYLTPSIKDGDVSWVCKSYPPKQSPSLCR